MATNICAGYKPEVFAPGFGPFAMAWGWCAVGALLGLLLGLHIRSCIHALEGHANHRVHGRGEQPGVQAPPGLQAMPAWHRCAEEAYSQCADPNRRVVLSRLLEDGDAALLFFAASTGVNRRIALARVLGSDIVQKHAMDWGL